MIRPITSFAAAFALLTLAACGGGSSNPTPVTPTTAPTAAPTAAPTSAPTSGTLSLTSAQSVTVPTTNGASGTMQVPAGTGTVNFAISATPPTGTTALQSIARLTRVPQSTRPLSASGDTAFVYVAFTVTSGTATLNGVPGFTLTLASAPTSPVYEALWNGTTWVTVGSAGTVSGTQITLAGTTTAETVTPNTPLFIVAYEGIILTAPTAAPSTAPTTAPTTTPTATPTPTPTPMPTPTPVPAAINVAPTTLSITDTANTVNPFTVSETGTGNTGTFTATLLATGTTNACAIATISTTQPVTAVNNSASFNVIATAAGNCDLQVTSSIGGTTGTITNYLTVTTTSIGISSQHRH